MFFLSYINDSMYLLGNLFFFKLVPPETNFFSNLEKKVELLMAQQANVFALLMEMFLLSNVNDTMYLLGNLPFFKTHVNCFTAHDSPCAFLSQNARCGRGAWCHFLRLDICLLSD